MSRPIASRPGFIPSLLGLVLLAELAIARFALTADANLVYVLGHPINIVCAARQHFGIPCPTCGFTRGFVLSVHGDFLDAWRLSPSGPLFAIAVMAATLLCFIFALLQMRNLPNGTLAFRRYVQTATLVYAGAGIVVWLATWVSVVRGMQL
ncbi:MAG TPA: DUF2752 domain-containing protein [Bryobacteraceae bacterium]|nr:DUF2752 domain-containing protein [Bryobacteraceae bacterium]